MYVTIILIPKFWLRYKMSIRNSGNFSAFRVGGCSSRKVCLPRGALGATFPPFFFSVTKGFTMAQSLEALEFPSVCEGSSCLEESSVLSEEEGGMLILQ